MVYTRNARDTCLYTHCLGGEETNLGNKKRTLSAVSKRLSAQPQNADLRGRFYIRMHSHNPSQISPTNAGAFGLFFKYHGALNLTSVMQYASTLHINRPVSNKFMDRIATTGFNASCLFKSKISLG